MTIRCLVALLTLAALVAPVAAERVEVAVAPIERDRTGKAAAALVEALERSGYVVIRPSAVSGAVFELGLDEDDLTEGDVQRVIEQLGVRALLQCSVAIERGVPTLRIRPHVEHARAAGFSLTIPELRSREIRRRLRTLIDERIGSHDPLVIRVPEVTPPTIELPPPPVVRVPPRARPQRPRRLAFELDAGVSVTKRALQFASRPFAQAPPSLDGAAVPGGRIEGALYPVRIARAVELGLAGELDRSVGYQLATSAEPATAVPGRAGWWSLGLRLRLGAPDRSLEVGVGVGRRTRSAQRDGLLAPGSLDLPDVEYATLEPAVGGRYAVGPITLLGALRALVIRDAGPIVDLDHYGNARSFGVAARAGIALHVRGPWSATLSAECVQVGFRFVGDGVMANARDGDPTSKDVGGARDRIYGAVLAAGYRY